MEKKWCAFRNAVVKEEKVPENIEAIDNEQLQYWMNRFVLEVRKKDGAEYAPNTLHHLCCGLYYDTSDNVDVQMLTYSKMLHLPTSLLRWILK